MVYLIFIVFVEINVAKCYSTEEKLNVISPLCCLGLKKGRSIDLCQQARCERLHVRGRNFPESSAYLC